MGNLIEICESAYNHAPLDSITKNYYRRRLGNKIICSECINDYIAMTSTALASCIADCSKKLFSLNGKVGEHFDITMEVNAPKYMEYLLPIKFTVCVTSYYSTDYSSEISDSLSAMSVSDIAFTNSNKSLKTNVSASVYSDVCPDIAPKFHFSADLSSTDGVEAIYKSVDKYLMAYVELAYPKITNELVQSIMESKSTAKYSSNCSCVDSTTTSHRCVNCSGSVTFEEYIYQNGSYCLDCMYELVVQSAVANGITDELGLSIENGKISTHYAIVNSTKWKQSVIDKYINTMTKLGSNPNITHYLMTLT